MKEGEWVLWVWYLLRSRESADAALTCVQMSQSPLHICFTSLDILFFFLLETFSKWDAFNFYHRIPKTTLSPQ